MMSLKASSYDFLLVPRRDGDRSLGPTKASRRCIRSRLF